MKSKKAQEYLQKCSKLKTKDSMTEFIVAIQAVKISEKEMIEKAIETHYTLCNRFTEIGCDWEHGICSRNCNYMKDFMNLLNN